MKVFLAGGQRLKKYPDEFEKIPYVLASFYDIDKWMLPICQQKPQGDFLLDSGAFTFLASAKRVDFDSYTDAYIDFVNEYQFPLFFEMDIDAVAGEQKAKALRERIERRTGKQPIVVWHANRGKDDFIGSCKDYPYVAFGGLITDGHSVRDLAKYIPWFIDKAHENGAKIHGLGFTWTASMDKYHFDTVDSSTWLGCGRFGKYFFFDGKKIVANSRPQGKRVADQDALLLHALNEWVKYQKYAETHL